MKGQRARPYAPTRIFSAFTRFTFGKSHHTLSQSHVTENCEFIDRIHKWRAINHSFIYVLIRPTSLVVKEYLFCILPVLTILVALISTKTEQHSFGRHSCIRCIGSTPFELADFFRPSSENHIQSKESEMRFSNSTHG